MLVVSALQIFTVLPEVGAKSLSLFVLVTKSLAVPSRLERMLLRSKLATEVRDLTEILHLVIPTLADILTQSVSVLRLVQT